MIEVVLDALALRRRALVWGYTTILLIYLASEYFCIDWLIDVLAWCFGDKAPSCAGVDFGGSALFVLGLFVGLIALFLWGGGRITDEIRSHQHWRNLPAIVVTALVLASNVLGVLWIFADWAKRSGGARAGEYHGFFASSASNDWRDFLVFAASTVLVFCVLFWKFRNLSRRDALVRLTYILLFASWLSFSLALPTNVVVNTSTEDEFFLLPISRFSLIIAVHEMLYAVWLGIYLLRPKPSSIPSSFSKRTADVRGGPYIDSAKTIASLLLAISYFGIQQGVSYDSGLDQIIGSRQAFSRDLVRTYLSSFPDYQIWRRAEGKSADSDETYQWMEHHLPKSFAGEMSWADSVEVRIVTEVRGIFMDTAVKQFEVRVRELNQAQPWVTRVGVDFAKLGDSKRNMPEISKVALSNGITPAKDEDFASLYNRMQTELLRRQVVLPNSGLSFPVGQVVWICLLISVVMQVLLDDRVRKVFHDPNFGRGEPWLILDAERGLARLVAWMWILALFLGPWVISVVVVRMTCLEVRFAGSGSYLHRELLTFGSLVFLSACSALLSLMTICDMLELRRLQRTQVSVMEGDALTTGKYGDG